MLVETTTLPIPLQQQILQFINSRNFKEHTEKSINTKNDNQIGTKKTDFVSAYDYFANIPVSDEIADIEFDLPPRNKTLYPPEDLD